MERAKIAHYVQEEDWDCGAAVAGLVLKNLGCTKIDHKKIMDMLGTNEKDGTQLNKLVRFFLSLPELDAKIKIRSTFEDLREEIDKGRVCIVAYQNCDTKEELDMLKSGHYAVVAEVTDDKVRLLDPGDEAGEYEFGMDEFENIWVEVDGEDDEDLFEGWMMSLRIPGI